MTNPASAKVRALTRGTIFSLAYVALSVVVAATGVGVFGPGTVCAETRLARGFLGHIVRDAVRDSARDTARDAARDANRDAAQAAKQAQAASSGPVSASIANQASGATDAYTYLGIRRRAQLASLNRYIRGGAFPRNRERPGETTIFVDGEGVRCPLADLMTRDGKDDLVDSIARNSNLLRLADATDGPLLAWIRGSGLTLREAAAIHPEYGYPASDSESEPARIQKHLWSVHDQLVERTPASLDELVRARLPEIRAELDVASVGFVETGASARGHTLVNRSSSVLHVLVTRHDDETTTTAEKWALIAGGESLDVPPVPEQRLLVEWRSDAKLAEFALEVTARSATDS